MTIEKPPNWAEQGLSFLGGIVSSVTTDEKILNNISSSLHQVRRIAERKLDRQLRKGITKINRALKRPAKV